MCPAMASLSCSYWLCVLGFVHQERARCVVKRMSVVLAACLMAGTALASDREALIAQIEAGGQNEFEDERHAVKVTDCQLTTYRWKKVEDEGWVLWTSF